ncbi:MAG: hypothetical protein ACYTFY_16955 [Planctomycetota bacterium]|jgi:hypothetical protein
MVIIIDRQRDEIIKDQLCSAFLNHKRDSARQPDTEEIEIDSSWQLSFNLPETPLSSKAEELFRQFMRECMNVSFSTTGKKEISFRISENVKGIENSTVTADFNKIEISASHEKGLLYGAMRLLKIFADRKAPFLNRGSLENNCSYTNRISSTVFYTSDLKLADIEEAFPHDYLALMAFFSVNGIFWEIDFFDYCGSDILPEIKCADYSENIKKLNHVVQRLSAYGINLHFLYSVPVLPEAHPVFEAHPELKGAFSIIGKEENGYCLCSSNKKVIEFFEDAFTKIYRDVPQLGGPILLVGGERFTHCYTRPAPPFTGKTNCSACSTQKPAQVVANLVNKTAAAIKKEAPEADVFCWPYSAFTWSGPEDSFQLELIRNLSTKVCFMSNFSTGDFCSKSNALLVDYNIMMPKASTRFKAQAEDLCKITGKQIYAKAECSTTPFMFHVPYLPVMYRWADRANALKKDNIKGVFYHYRYYGFSGSIADELAMESGWNDLETDEFLKKYCLREYGEFSPEILAGWRQMSKAWDKIPYSMALSGERQYYVKGPIYLGPAHPFIFDVQNNYGLKRGFTRIRGSVLFPNVSEEKREKLSSPAYSSDLMWTWPMGSEKCEEDLLQTYCAWSEGVNIFTSALQQPNPESQLDVGICKLIGIHFKTAYNLVRFYRMRDNLLSNGGKNAEAIDKKLKDMKSILLDEIANSLAAIELIKKDPRLGYGYSYGIVYDEQMIREKISQCKYVIDVEMPKLRSGLRFHMFGIYP